MQKLFHATTTFLLLTVAANAQEGPILEHSVPLNNGKLGGVYIARPQGDALDANGDGVEDLVTVDKTNKALVAKSGNSNETWAYPLSATSLQGARPVFLGFYEMNLASPQKEAVFGKRNGKGFSDVEVIEFQDGSDLLELKFPENQQPTGYKFSENQLLIGIQDMGDDDPQVELHFLNIETQMIEYWGPGPELELFPGSAEVDSIKIDTDNKAVSYATKINGKDRTLIYTFLADETVDFDVLDGSGANLLHFNSGDGANIPAGTDEEAAWLAQSNPIISTDIGIRTIWQLYADAFSNVVQTSAASFFKGIGNILGGLGDLIETICNGTSTASCTQSDGTTIIKTCVCGIVLCVQQTITVEVPIIVIDPVTGEQEIRTEYETQTICHCYCKMFKKKQLN